MWGTLKEVGVSRGGVGDTKRGGCGVLPWWTGNQEGIRWLSLGRGWGGGSEVQGHGIERGGCGDCLWTENEEGIE